MKSNALPLQIYLFLQDEPFFLAAHLAPLLERFRVVGVVISGQKLPKDSWVRVITRYVCLLGFIGFICLAIKVSYLRLTRQGSLAKLFAQRQIPFIRAKNINSPSVIELVRRSGATLLVSVACPQIFSPLLLEAAPQGAINLHGGLLPDYPGVMTPFWNLYESASEAGCTLHFMTTKVDGGDVIGQRRFAISPSDTVHTLYGKIIEEGMALLEEGLQAIETHEVVRTSVVYRPDRYHTFPTWSEGQRFRKRGLRFF